MKAFQDQDEQEEGPHDGEDDAGIPGRNSGDQSGFLKEAEEEEEEEEEEGVYGADGYENWELKTWSQGR